MEDLIRRDQAELSLESRSQVQYPLHRRLSLAAHRFAIVVLSHGSATVGLIQTTANVVWKWWDEAVIEEMRARDRHVLQLAEKVENLTVLPDYETEQKLHSLEKIVGDIVKEKSDQKYGFECFVIGMVLVVVVIAMVVMFV
ncbi:Uncharacterized protein Rs2_28075 [Raphanus sativus]|nr:Uncharacterized protein Rs2_28075 [Raphanus sativus]